MPENKNVTMEGVRILFRNFEGKEGQYNRAGDRNFSVVLPPDVADAMEKDGWNVKRKAPREEGDDPLIHLPVAVSFKGRPPRCVMITSKGRTQLDEDSVALLDFVDIKNVDLIVNPYHWTMNGNTGVKAYLHAIYVTIEEDYLQRKYEDVPELGGSPEPLALNRGSEEYDETHDIVDAEIVEE